MNPESTTKQLIGLASILILATTTSTVGGTEDAAEDSETHRVVHSVRVHCEDDSEKCAKHVEIMSLEDGAGHYKVVLGPHATGGFLGVRLTELTPELRSHFGVGEEAGVMISKVEDDSAAFRAGVQVGDIVTSVDGVTVASTFDLVHAIRGYEAGVTVNLEVWRDGSLQTLAATLEESQSMQHLASRNFTVDCGDGNEDCNIMLKSFGDHSAIPGCEGDDDCDVRVTCADGDCDCILNGDPVECSDIPGFTRRHD